ncbi:hypothetical protein Tco_0256060 [Tanacetum coccineum]
MSTSSLQMKKTVYRSLTLFSDKLPSGGDFTMSTSSLCGEGVNTPGSDENRLKLFDLMYILVNGAVAAKSGSCCLRDVAASFDSAVHRVHAVSFDAVVASIVSAACCADAGYFVYCCCLLCTIIQQLVLNPKNLCTAASSSNILGLS